MAYNSFINKQVGIQSPTFRFQKDRANATIVSGDGLGQFQFFGFDGTSYLLTSAITSTSSGTIAANRIGSNLEFYTHPDAVTASTQRMVLESTGQLQINDPSSNVATLFVTNNQSTPNINLRTANATATNAPHLHFNRSRAGTADVLANDELGRLEYLGFQGGTAREAAKIASVAETVNGTNAVSGYLSFRTVPTTYAAMAERVRISANGNVTVNSPVSGAALTVNQTTASSAIGTSQTFGGAATIQNIQTSNDVQPVYYNVYKRRTGGTLSNGDVIHQINGFGQNAGVDYTATLTRSVATTIGAGFVAGSLDWWTTSSAGATNQRMILSPDGFVTINIPAAAGSALTVNGVNSAANYSLISQAAVAGGIHNAARLWNYDGTAGSATQVSIDVFNQLATTGGDPSLRFLNIGIRAVTLGIDSSTDQFVIANSSALGSGNILTWTASNNQINLPLQCSFHAWISTAQNNVTGAGTYYNVIFQTERFDVSSSYNNTTGVFTAPATGKYLFTSQLEFTGITAAMTWGDMGFQVNGTAFVGGLSYINVGAAAVIGTFISLQNTCIMSLSAGDTVVVRTRILNGAGDTADLAVATSSFFAGQLLS